MNYPKLYLAIDNCFASKRWTNPNEWMDIARSLGLVYVEASADNECDPMYAGQEYLKRWTVQVQAAVQETGVNISGLYSGHGTYATLGLTHTDEAVRHRMRDVWAKPMINLAAGLHTGLGCYCFAFPDSVLQNADLYQRFYDELCDNLALLCTYASEQGLPYFAIEQMYTPHQVPFTLEGTENMLRRVYGLAGCPLYITVDTGHQIGQSRFVKPTGTELEMRIQTGYPGWLGPRKAYEVFQSDLITKKKIASIQAAMKETPWMFARKDDGNTNQWFRQFGLYSPIIHLQQTDGNMSAHWPFTAKYNSLGKIRGEDLLNALMDGVKAPEVPGMPPRVENIYLTLEVFSGTASYNYDILQTLRESVIYWRQFVPRDGIPLDEAWLRQSEQCK
jgi:D-erythrulose 1-phosphate 3-epimerase